MSKVFKKIGKAVKSATKWVKKNWKPIVATVAVVFAAGWATAGNTGMSAAYSAAKATSSNAFTAGLKVAGSTLWAGTTAIAGTFGVGSGASGFVAREAGMTGSTLLTGAGAQAMNWATPGGSLVPGAGANTGLYTGWGSGAIGSEGALFGNLGATPPATGTTPAPGGTTTTPLQTAPAPTGGPAGGIMDPASPNYLPPGGTPGGPTAGIMDPSSVNFVPPAYQKWALDPATGRFGPTPNNFLTPAVTSTVGYVPSPGGTTTTTPTTVPPSPAANPGFWDSYAGYAAMNGFMGLAGGALGGLLAEDLGPVAQWGYNMDGSPNKYAMAGMVDPNTGVAYTDADLQALNSAYYASMG